MKKIFTTLLIFVVLLLVAIFGYVSYVNNSHQQNVQAPLDQTAGWNTLKNNELGFELKYPAGFDSKYASFAQDPIVIITAKGDAKIDSSGCYKIDVGDPTKDSQIIINNTQFCLSVAGDPGAGQLYNTSDYTMLRDGNYITLQYIVRTLNGCGPYIGTPDAVPCMDFMNNYYNNVTKLIEASVGTLQFIK